MTSANIRSLLVATAALLIIAGNAAAENKDPALLNSIEVQQLVARAEPGDNVRLSAHFAALADRYDAEAKRHSAMSHGFVGNPRGTLGAAMSVHCKRLADLNEKSATTVRELAAYHRKLAGGAPAMPPEGAAAFQNGAGARVPTDRELTELAAKATTPAEHRTLMEYFTTLATRYTRAANEHVALAQAYRGTRLATAAVHHDTLAGFAREEAKEATAAAAMHKDLAAVAR